MVVPRNKEDMVNKHMALNMVAIQYLVDTYVFVDQIIHLDTDMRDQTIEFALEKNQVEFQLRTWVMTMV